MQKKRSELVKGDIIHTEFGDYGNFVTVIVDEVEDSNLEGWTRISCHYKDGQKEVMFGESRYSVDVIGHV